MKSILFAPKLTIPIIWKLLRLPGEPGTCCRNPFREDENASFSVSVDGLLYNDFAERQGGNIFHFFQRATRLPFEEARKALIELAGDGFNCIQHIPPARLEENKEQPSLPHLRKGNINELNAVAQLRRLSLASVQLASRRGLLWFGEWKYRPAWFITDSERVNAQARCMDGAIWPVIKKKAQTLPGCWGKWPVGIAEAQAHSKIVMVEGGPDLLAAFHFIACQKPRVHVAPVAMFGAGMSIHHKALPLFKGKHVRIIPDLDESGQKAAIKWQTQLIEVGAKVEIFDLSKFKARNGEVKDLNDLTLLKIVGFRWKDPKWRIMP